MQLSSFDNSSFERGKPWFIEVIWRIVEGLFFHSCIPGSAWRVWVLRLFGARVGTGVVVKPYARIKFPWKLSIGDNSWIGEDVWIDNLAEVNIGQDCCLSQGVYLCTGNHHWDQENFSLFTQTINIESHCWIGAQSRIAPGVHCSEGAVLSMGSVATDDLESWMIHSGFPAKPVRVRPSPSPVSTPDALA